MNKRNKHIGSSLRYPVEGDHDSGAEPISASNLKAIIIATERNGDRLQRNVFHRRLPGERFDLSQ